MMKYFIDILRDEPRAPGECVSETILCTDKADLDMKYVALNQRRGPDIIRIEVKHEDDRKERTII